MFAAVRPTVRAAAMALAFAAAALGASFSFLQSARAAADVAQDKVPPSYGAMMKMKPMDVMHMMDTEKQGYVTREQFMKFHEAMFEKMDKNKDGQVSAKEWATDRSKDAGG
jgi:hypothetical protein